MKDYGLLTINQHIERMTAIGRRKDVIYDKKEVLNVINFFEKHLILNGDFNGKPFTLMPWQKELIIEPIFGFKYKDDGFPVIRELYAQLSRGTGKSAFNAGILLYYLLFGGDGIRLYCVGSTKNTAKTTFGDCVDIFFNSPDLHKYIDYRGVEYPVDLHTIKRPRNILEVISADNRFDGPRPACCSYDEYHRSNSSELHTIFKQSQKKLRKSLMITITNAGVDLTSPCYAEYVKSKQILNHEIEDDSFLCLIPEPNTGDKWDSLETAKKVNLGLGVNVYTRDLQQELTEAINIPYKKTDYVRYRLNTWQIGGRDGWLPYEKWDLLKDDFTESDLFGCPAWVGVDKSAKTDLTSITLLVSKDDLLHVISYNYRPDDKLINTPNEAPYGDWLESGNILSAGHPEYILDSVLLSKLEEINRNFDLKLIGFDRALAGDLFVLCEEKQLPVVVVQQYKTVTTEPINKLEEFILMGKLRHNNDPCLNWQFSNSLIKVDPSGLKQFVKHARGTTKRNDAMIALQMAMFCFIQGELPDESNTNDHFYDNFWAVDKSNVDAKNDDWFAGYLK